MNKEEEAQEAMEQALSDYDEVAVDIIILGDEILMGSSDHAAKKTEMSGLIDRAQEALTRLKTHVLSQVLIA